MVELGRASMPPDRPTLLFDDECGVCRHIARWVRKSAHAKAGEATLTVRPIGDDPEALRLLHPGLDIWDAYATIHLLLPDGSMKLGGEAVAGVLRSLPNTRWFAWIFGLGIFGFRPFQSILDLGYAILADVRPIFGCKSCGETPFWARPLAWVTKRIGSARGGTRPANSKPHFTSLARPRKSLGPMPFQKPSVE